MKKSFTTGGGRTLSYTKTGTGPLLVCHAGHFVWFDEPDRFREEVARFLLD